MVRLIGVIVAPLVMSLATQAPLRRRERVLRVGITISARRFAWQGAVFAIAATGSATLALTLN